MKTIKDCNRVMQSSESVQLANDVRIVPDKTFNQREEARRFRTEKEKQEDLLPSTSTQEGEGRERRRRKRGIHGKRRFSRRFSEKANEWRGSG